MNINYNIPYTFCIEPILTNKCNLNCTYCFERCKAHKSDFDIKNLVDLMSKGYHCIPQITFYLMGGEPMVAMESIDELRQYINNCDRLSKDSKGYLLDSINSSLTTNGTLIDKHMSDLINNNMSLQISLDGPKDINDKCRIDKNGKGLFDKISSNMDLLDKYNIPYSVHGAISKDNYANIPEIVEFHLKYRMKNTSIENLKSDKSKLFNLMHSNVFMYVIEDDITDDDIDTFLNAHIRLYDLFMNSPYLDGLTTDEKKYVLLGFLLYSGGPCGASKTLMTVQNNGKGYGCHRIARVSTDEPIELWNCEEGFVNTNIGNHYADPLAKDLMYSVWWSGLNESKSAIKYPRMMWCPSTNIKYTGEASVMPPRYATLMSEFSNFVEKYISYYDLKALDRYR